MLLLLDSTRIDVADVISGTINLPIVDPISVVREKRRDIVSSVSMIGVGVGVVLMDWYVFVLCGLMLIVLWNDDTLILLVKNGPSSKMLR